MAGECLRGLSTSDIPELRGGIASTGDEDILVWTQRETGQG